MNEKLRVKGWGGWKLKCAFLRREREFYQRVTELSNTAVLQTPQPICLTHTYTHKLPNKVKKNTEQNQQSKSSRTFFLSDK